MWMLFGTQFCANLCLQFAFLSVIHFNFDFVCLSVPELFVFMVALLLSDFAAAANQFESAWFEQHEVVSTIDQREIDENG